MLNRLIIGLITMNLMVCLAVWCSQETDGADSSEMYSIKIFFDEELVKSVTLDEIEALDKVVYSTEDKDEEGPSLFDVLRLADIKEFSQIL